MYFHHHDKQSKEKADALKAFGADVKSFVRQRGTGRSAFILFCFITTGKRSSEFMEGKLSTTIFLTSKRTTNRQVVRRFWDQTDGKNHTLIGRSKERRNDYRNRKIFEREKSGHQSVGD